MTVIILHKNKTEEIKESLHSLYSLSPTLNTPAEVIPTKAKTSNIKSHELYVDKTPYCSALITLVKTGVVIKFIPLRINEVTTKAKADFAGAGIFVHLLIKLFITKNSFLKYI